VDALTSAYIVGAALLIATPSLIFFGWLSDHTGRKPVILGGMLLAAITYYPLYLWLGTVTQPGNINYPIAISIIFNLVCYVGMVYGPVGAFLAEYFPGKIRYTSVSVPYHIGNGWGGRIGAVHHYGSFRGHRQHRLRADLPDRGSRGVLPARPLPNAGDS
jgi:MFS family permease